MQWLYRCSEHHASVYPCNVPTWVGIPITLVTVMVRIEPGYVGVGFLDTFHLLRWGLLLALNVSKKGIQGNQWALALDLSIPGVTSTYHHAWLSTWVLGFQTQVVALQSKGFSDGAIALVPLDIIFYGLYMLTYWALRGLGKMNISIFQVRKCRHKRIEECAQWRVGNSDTAWLQSVHILAMFPRRMPEPWEASQSP